MPKNVPKTAPKNAPKNVPKVAPETAPKIALVCDWLTEIGGAEQVLKTLHEMFPDAPIYTSMYRKKVDYYFQNDTQNAPNLPQNTPKTARNRQGSVATSKPFMVRTGWLNHLPAASRRFIAPLRQAYFSHLDLSDYDLVISVTGCDAKFVKTRPGTHLCYCHVPTQYYWGKYEDYLKNPGFGILNPLARATLKLLVPRLRKNDLKAAARPDYYVTISSYAAREIKKYYKRESKVIPPPVNVELFQQLVENSKPNREIKHQKSQTLNTTIVKSCQIDNTITNAECQAKKSEQKYYTLSTVVENSENFVRFLQNNRGKYYINFSRQVNWKRLDLAIAGCIKAKKPLILIGDGPEHENLVKLAKNLETSNSPSSTVLFLPAMPQAELKAYLKNARAFIFPSEEPFGIAPVEALAAGCPVVALKSGGALDYIREGENGLFFASQTTDSVARALKRFESSPVSRRRHSTISSSAKNFSEPIFREKMLKYIHEIQSK